MSHYLLRNVVTGETLGPYPESKVPAVLWGKARGEWMIYKELQGEAQAVINRMCKRNSKTPRPAPASTAKER